MAVNRVAFVRRASSLARVVRFSTSVLCMCLLAQHISHAEAVELGVKNDGSGIVEMSSVLQNRNQTVKDDDGSTDQITRFIPKLSTKQTASLCSLVALTVIYYYFFMFHKKDLKSLGNNKRKLSGGVEYEGQLNGSTLTPQGNGKLTYADGSALYSNWKQGTPSGRSVAKYMQADPLNLYTSLESCKSVDRSVLKPFSQLLDVATQKKALDAQKKHKKDIVWTQHIGKDVKVRILELPLELIVDLQNVRRYQNTTSEQATTSTTSSTTTTTTMSSAMFVWNHTSMENGMFEGHATVKFENLVQLLGTYHKNALHGPGVQLVPDKWVWHSVEDQSWVQCEGSIQGCHHHGSHCLIDSDKGAYLKLEKLCAEWRAGTLVDGQVQLCWKRLDCFYCREQEEKAEEQRAEEQKAEEQRAEEQRAEEQKAEEQKAEEQKAEEQKAQEEKAKDAIMCFDDTKQVQDESPLCPPSSPPKLIDDFAISADEIMPLETQSKASKKPALKLQVQEEAECTIILDTSGGSVLTISSNSTEDDDEAKLHGIQLEQFAPSSDCSLISVQYTPGSVPSTLSSIGDGAMPNVFTFADEGAQTSAIPDSVGSSNGSGGSDERARSPRKYKFSPYPRALTKASAIPSPLVMGIIKQISRNPKTRNIPITLATPKTPKVKERKKAPVTADAEAVTTTDSSSSLSSESNTIETVADCADSSAGSVVTEMAFVPETVVATPIVASAEPVVPLQHTKANRKQKTVHTSASAHQAVEFDRYLSFRTEQVSKRVSGAEAREVDVSTIQQQLCANAGIDGRDFAKKAAHVGLSWNSMLARFASHRLERDSVRDSALRHCRCVVGRLWPDSVVCTYGSFPLETSLPYSDVDLVVALPAPTFAFPLGGVGHLSRNAVLYLSEFILTQLQSTQCTILFPKIDDPGLFHPPADSFISQKTYYTPVRCCCCGMMDKKTVFYSIHPIYHTAVPIIKLQLLVPRSLDKKDNSLCLNLSNNGEWCSICYTLMQVDISFYFTAPRSWLKESLKRIHEHTINGGTSRYHQSKEQEHQLSPFAKFLYTGSNTHDVYGGDSSNNHLVSDNSGDEFEISNSKPLIDISYPKQLDFPASPLLPIERNERKDPEPMNTQHSSDMVLQCALQMAYHSTSFLSSSHIGSHVRAATVPSGVDHSMTQKRWVSPPLQASQSANETGLEEFAAMVSLHSGVCSTHIAAAAMQCLPVLKPLIIALKAVLAAQNMHMSFSGGLPPYVCSILCIAFLIKRGARSNGNFLRREPGVHITEVTGLSDPCSANEQGVQFLEILYFYGHVFNPERTGVAIQSPYLFYPLLRAERVLTVHDLAVAEQVVSSSCFNFSKVQYLFRQTLADLLKTSDIGAYIQSLAANVGVK